MLQCSFGHFVLFWFVCLGFSAFTAVNELLTLSPLLETNLKSVGKFHTLRLKSANVGPATALCANFCVQGPWVPTP